MKNKKEYALRIFSWILFIGNGLVILYTTRYALFRGDDFGFSRALSSGGDNMLINSIKGTIRIWKGWQGTFTTCLAMGWINPVREFNLPMLRILLGILFASLYFGIYLSGYWIVRYMELPAKYAIYIVTLIVLPTFIFGDYSQNIVWFNGAMAYALPAAFMFIGISMLLMGMVKKKTGYYIASGILLFLMTGGVLEAVGMGEWILLWLLVVDGVKNKRLNRAGTVVFAVTMAGACLNAFAPGNFVRYGGNGKMLIPLLQAMIGTARTQVDGARLLFQEKWCILALLLAFTVGCSVAKKIEKKLMLIYIIGVIFLPFVTIFPVVLGYRGNTYADLTIHTLFLFILSLMICLVGLVFIAGSQLKAYQILPDWKMIVYVTAVIVSVLFLETDWTDAMNFRIFRQLANGSIKNYAAEWEDVYEELMNSDEDEFVATVHYVHSEGSVDTKIVQDPDFWVNKDVAAQFGKKSVSVSFSPATGR